MAQHIWDEKQHLPIFDRSSDVVEPEDNLQSTNPCETSTVDTIDLRVMTYNIWHNNPPEWLIHHR